MSDIQLETIRLTYKQRAWVMSYLMISAPHPPDDPFCRLLMELLTHPPAKEPDLDYLVELFPDLEPKA